MKNAERLAALLDGRLDSHQRDELLTEIAASEDDFGAYADAVAITAELEGAAPEVTPINAVREVTPILVAPEVTPTEVAPGVKPIHAAPLRRRGLAPRWLAIAAVLAGIALAPWLWTRFAADRGDLVTVEANALPSGWDASPWGATRGAGDPLTPEARAVRLGARLVDVELAVRGRDPATAQLATETAMLLEGIPGAVPAASIYREVARRAGEPAERLDPLLDRGREVVPQIAGEEGVKLGAWFESARIAAAARDDGFFASQATRSQLERMARDSSLDPSARDGVERIRAATVSSGDADWRSVQREATALLRLLGR
ncbi:MAG TPA: hypothetical protein VGB92_16995 [Longimicrobium sp.]